ncbi:hypothetical protein ES705_40291 [subsurface metagenome]
MLMVIIINKKGLILCREDGAKDQQSGGTVNLEDVVIELLFHVKLFYRSWMSQKNI